MNVGAALGGELVRALARHAASIPLEDLAFASNAACALDLRASAQQMEVGAGSCASGAL